ncbi:MAG: HepT-like ribonuclease domain-containing protein [Lysobacterales bacterium]
MDRAKQTVRMRNSGLPQDARDAFTLLEGACSIDTDNAARMRAMVGFRNVAVHRYRDLSLPTLRAIRDTRDRRLHRVRQAGRLADRTSTSAIPPLGPEATLPIRRHDARPAGIASNVTLSRSHAKAEALTQRKARPEPGFSCCGSRDWRRSVDLELLQRDRKRVRGREGQHAVRSRPTPQRHR